MIMRRRPLLRAAAVGGGAYMAGKSRGRKAEEQASAQAEQDQRITDLEQQQAASGQPAAQVPAQGGPSFLDQLNQLGTLHDQGSLTDEEFTAAKAKLLAK